jgi:hypothetical protein
LIDKKDPSDVDGYEVRYVFERGILVKYAIFLAVGIIYGAIYDFT